MPFGRRIPIAVPWPVRRRLYNWHPSRARRWREWPGLERLTGTRAVLTFDDGPGTDATPQVLDQLERLGVVATFFVLGAEVLREPELARRIVADGHELGLHGFAHPRFDLLSEEQARADLEQGLEAIETTTGVRPSRFRPPYGKLADGSYQACLSLDLKVVYWSTWGLDWEEIGAGAIGSEVTSSLSAGAVILLHDTARYGRRASAHATADALPQIVARGEQLGLTWTTLTEAIHEPT
jgi:peptidoglycan/xylan/chitin deacetylase (PgdA/CDA1 family)